MNGIYLVKTRMNANKNFGPWLRKKLIRLQEQLEKAKRAYR